MGNILNAIRSIIEFDNKAIIESTQSKNRLHSTGSAFEEYIQRAFSNTFTCDENTRLIEKKRVFSHIGTSTKPPDIILRGGDAIEIKKIQRKSNAIALNSSFPKSKLFSDDPLLSKKCRACEEWKIKDFIYVIGQIEKNFLRSIWLLYGDCFAADKEVYWNLISSIKNASRSDANIIYRETKELAKINKVDPLGITDMRVRGMWHIKHPDLVYNYLKKPDSQADFELTWYYSKRKIRLFS